MKFITKTTLLNLMVIFVSLILTLGVLEFCVRIYESEYKFHNFWELDRDLFRSAYPAEFHKQLGWIPKRGTTIKENVWGTEVTILRDGIRANGKRTISSSKERSGLILAIGDSFTFGDQASDNDTWPAYLEDLTGIKALNGGVFGYGLDQSYLRMKSLAKQYQPTHIVLSLIPVDISRCELSERTSVAKPYFEIIENKLLLRNDHISEKSKSENQSFLRHTLGYSFLIHKLMLRVFPEYWLQGSFRSTKAHSDGEAITCRLFEEIKVFLAETPTIQEFYLLIQYEYQTPRRYLEMIDRVLSCLNEDKIKVVNLRSVFSELKQNDYEKYQRMFLGLGHMTAEGNYLVAHILSQAITK